MSSDHRPLPSPYGVEICADCGLVFDGYHHGVACSPKEGARPTPQEIRAVVDLVKRRAAQRKNGGIS